MHNKCVTFSGCLVCTENELYRPDETTVRTVGKEVAFYRDEKSQFVHGKTLNKIFIN